MEFQLVQEVSETLLKNGKASLISNFSEDIKDFFSGKSYGKGILSIFIAVICVAPEFDFFFKIRTPKYKRGKEIIRQDNIGIEIESSLRFDLKLSYEKFAQANEIDAIRLLALELLNSLNVLDELKIKDFNSIRFKEDFRIYLSEQKVI